MKDFSDRLEAMALWLAFAVFRMLGADKASTLGGWIGRTVGPLLAASRKADTNLKNSMPALSASERAAIIKDMWDNLGRVIAEYPHLKHIILNNVEIVNEHFLHEIGKDSSFLLIGGHLANWELVPFYMNYRVGSDISGIFREPNNPYAAKLLDKCRNPEDKGAYIAKSSAGARTMVKTLQQGGRIGLLIDQKYNQGIPVEFFGRAAMTSVAAAQLALKFNIPILPLQIERFNGNHFRLTLHDPIKTEGRSEAEIMLEANRLLEGWVRAKPGQWLWLHRRWDSKALKDTNN